MRFLINVLDTQGSSGTADEMTSIALFNQSLRRDSHWVLAAGIADPSHSILIDNRNGAGFKERPAFSTGEEFVSGFWIIEVSKQSEAEALALEASKACNRRVEVRPFLGN